MTTREHIVVAGAGMAFGLIILFFTERDFKQSVGEIKPITTSLTFTVTNRLAVTHYVIIPTTIPEWRAMTSRYPAHVTQTVLNFK